jgi:predicted dehydrogenase
MKSPTFTRREMIKASAGAAALASVAPLAYAQAGATLKVGLIGAGSRGTGAAMDIARSADGIEITALADLYPEQLEKSRSTLEKRVPDNMKVTKESMHSGVDAYKKVIESDVDVVLLCAYPHFRPKHAEAAINAGKHIFAEKPIAVDPVGVRKFIEVGKKAKEKGLAVLAGTQRRHAPNYNAAVQAVHDGKIGKIVGGSVFFCRAAGRTPKPRREGESDMDWMLRNWWWFSWLSGGMIGQLVIHQIDIMHWIMGGPCRSAYGFGGREVYREPVYGNIFDHFTVMYEYPGGEQFHAYTRQTPGTDGNISDTFLGGKGRLYNASRRSVLADWNNKPIEIFRGEGNPYVLEHTNMVNSIRAGEPINESQNVAESTLMAIMGQISAWTGKKLDFEEMMQSDLDFTPPSYETGVIPAVPVPGKELKYWA